MKNLFFFWAFFVWSSSLLSQVSTCDLELLDIDWDDKTISLTLNDNICSNSSTPFWVPTGDSIYVMQLGFSFGGTTCLMPASAFTIFYPPLGLNDTITYYFGNFQDEFNCFNSAFEYYQENCIVTVSAVGPNNSINLDLIGSNNYIGFNPIFDNCYGSVGVIDYIRNSTRYIHDIYGNLIHTTTNIESLNLHGFYIIRDNKGARKYFIK
tara:strand:- start:225 stop:851 length:627 start_codon:yes stop_codon:yes gene_type:complete